MKKIFSSLIALTLILQPMAAGATAESDSWLDMINGSSSSSGSSGSSGSSSGGSSSGSSYGSSSSVPQYPGVSSVAASKWKMVSGDTTTISYSLYAYASNLQVNVYPVNSTSPVATLYNAFQNAGSYSVQWTASATPVGTYKVEVKATNVLGVTAVGSTKVYIVPSASKAAALTNVSVSPATFSQGGSTTVSFAVDTVSLVTVNVMPLGYDSTTEPLFSKDVVMSGSGSNSVTWDGRNKYGNYVSAADYVVLVAALNDVGATFAPDKSVRFGSGGFVSFVTPGISIFDLSPNPLNSVFQNMTVKFNLDAQAVIAVAVKNASGSTVFTDSKSASSTQIGFNQYVYNGTVTSSADQGQTTPYAKNGSYTITLTASNAYGSSTDSRSFTVTGNPSVTEPSPFPLYISGTTFTPNPFDVVHTNATVTYTLWNGTSFLVEFDVFDSNGALVYSTGKQTKSSGFNSMTYTGVNSSGTLLPSGNYTFKVRVYDLGGSFLSGSPIGSFQVINNPVIPPPPPTVPSISGTTFSPNPFNVVNSNATVSYTLSGSSALVEFNVFGSNGGLVYTTGKQSKSVGFNSLTYTGVNSNGSLLPSGNYTYDVRVYDFNGNFLTQSPNGSFQVINNPVPPQTNKPYFSSVSFSPNPFNVKTSNATVGFTLSTGGWVRLNIFNNTSAQVYSGSQINMGSGYNTISYGGYNNSNALLPSGNYTYQLISSDVNGTQVDTATGSFQVVNDPYVVPPQDPVNVTPYFNWVSFSPSTFDVRNTNATLSFSLQKSGYINVRVEDANGNTVYTMPNLSGITYLPNMTHSFTYGGTYNNGSLLPSGTYKYVITSNAVSSPWGSDVKSGYFTVVNNPVNPPPQPPYPPQPANAPVISGLFATPNPFNPDLGSLKVNYTLSTSAYATVTILKDNNIVKTLKVNQLENGSNSAVWDGKFPDGKFESGKSATAGTYVFRVAAYNSFGSARTIDTPFTVMYTTTIQTPCAGFKDVSVTSAYCSAVEEMKRLGVFSGYNDGTFRPETPINRAETVKVIMMALKYNVPTSGWWFDSAGFKDVSSSAWYTPYLAAARIYGVINGYPDNSFKPENTVNRAEMLKIFLEGANIGQAYVKCDKPYQDNTAGKWFSKYACIAKQYVLVDAVDGKFVGGKAMTRGDVAVMIYRAQILGLLTNLPPKKQVVLPQLSTFKPGTFYPNEIVQQPVLMPKY